MTLCHILPELRGWVNRIIRLFSVITGHSLEESYSSAVSIVVSKSDENAAAFFCNNMRNNIFSTNQYVKWSEGTFVKNIIEKEQFVPSEASTSLSLIVITKSWQPWSTVTRKLPFQWLLHQGVVKALLFSFACSILPLVVPY